MGYRATGIRNSAWDIGVAGALYGRCGEARVRVLCADVLYSLGVVIVDITGAVSGGKSGGPRAAIPVIIAAPRSLSVQHGFHQYIQNFVISGRGHRCRSIL